MRLDQWLWAVRIYKTRPLAVTAIKNSRIHVDGAAAKPSHTVRAGEIITARMEHTTVPWTRTVRVLDAPKSRVGAKLVPQFLEELTSAEELEKARSRDPELLPPAVRAPGTGRPTKRERRALDEHLE